MSPRVIILRAPGTNCDQETAFAFEQAGARADIVHINRWLEHPVMTGEYQILCIPGGFSYGDDIAAGRIFGNSLLHHVTDALREFRDSGKLILGICNGFQVLLKTDLLLDKSGGAAQATLTENNHGRYEDRWVNVRVASAKSVFLDGLESMYLPIAHAEGKFVTADAATLSALDAAGQLVLRYADSQGSYADEMPFPLNPNGAQANVAGVSDSSGRVLGMMPHPERYLDRTHHPRWTRGEGADPGDGAAIFANAVKFFS
jgi:phosphoribosylformylglycinamidine synthase subunit PurQ / glutaminase